MSCAASARPAPRRVRHCLERAEGAAPGGGVDVGLDRLQLLRGERGKLDAEDVLLGALAVVPDGSLRHEGASAPDRHDQLDLTIDVAMREMMGHTDAQPADADVASIEHVEKAVPHDVD